MHSSCLAQQGLLSLIDVPLFDGCAAFAACPEEHHVNMLGFKLSGMLARSHVDRLVVVTVDGSMHCIQLHYLAEEAEKMGLIRRREHYVIEGRRLIRIDPEAVRVSRFLSKVSRLLEGNTRSTSG